MIDPRYASTRLSLPGEASQHFAPWIAPQYAASTEFTYVVVQADIGCSDLIADRVWQREDLWWAILHYNGIADAFTLQPGDKLLIPPLGVVLDALARMKARGPLTGDDLDGGFVRPLQLQVPSPVQPLTRLLGQAQPARDPITLTGGYVVLSAPPAELAHYQVQISLDGDFDPVLLSRMTMNNVTGWQYLDGDTWTAFPEDGLTTVALTSIRYHLTELDLTRCYARWRSWVGEAEQPWQLLT